MAVVVCHTDRPSRTWRFEPASIVAAHKRVYARRGIHELVFIMAAFGLSPAETGRLFHVRRQAVNAWMHEGVPLPRLAQVGRVAQAAEALRGFFKPERLPAIVRGAMPALERRSILETIATRGTEPVLQLVEELRSWTPSSESTQELRAQ
ncbi:MAG: hypothetical protein QOI11_10 [Candidatus Eremiobacteraeota bacterium]|jgi:hypothetical protein|nr:hypothetical protein [Candidatus Eremiobacteraeota bacterium]